MYEISMSVSQVKIDFLSFIPLHRSLIMYPVGLGEHLWKSDQTTRVTGQIRPPVLKHRPSYSYTRLLGQLDTGNTI